MQPFDTHEVRNTVAPFENVNLYAADLALQEALVREGAADAADALHALGAELGRADTLALGRLANLYAPTLHNYDSQGHRIDEVEFHPGWHRLMALLIGHGAHSSPWQGGAGAQVARAARYLLFGQVENGAQCPVTMTYAAVPALKQAPKLALKWLPKILSNEYDPRSLPVEQKNGAIIGMGMTEKQGGSDVRANTTRAAPLPPSEARALFGEDGEQVFRIVGHKWFFSAPQSDAHLILAQTDGEDGAGLSCFFLPRYLPNGERNAIRVQRLKDKVGNRSNASAEVEFTGAYGWLIGKPGRGIPTILEMGSHTRLDCVLGSAGAMRAALTHALHHARRRVAFGRPLAEQPLMQNVLADLALESEAATAFAMRLARCFDQAADPVQAMLARVLTPAGKYWICKRGPAFGAEAMEVIGGSGYVEDSPLARLYRELPVNSIWEGSGNVMCLDLLRALGKSPEARDALAAELAEAGNGDTFFVAYRSTLMADLAQQQPDEFGARLLAERVVLAVQAGLLLRHAPPFVSSAFMASRLKREPGGAFGRLPNGVDCAAILARALVE
ncbi:isovaleryl-CoA dehydrogenase [Duganella callida]|uniref:Isovaleryl-CoA dehydrogenase n=1 Tax=Duganella callida TaxID=2561932 RepID=A0A4Y9SBC4_9BURK|nr:isovaleryl-CoA dehydrogenase [Duganella callida]TFW17504.1 isovaleryl-CoA dehydrogenase [Duganella callida]